MYFSSGHMPKGVSSGHENPWDAVPCAGVALLGRSGGQSRTTPFLTAWDIQGFIQAHRETWERPREKLPADRREKLLEVFSVAVISSGLSQRH